MVCETPPRNLHVRHQGFENTPPSGVRESGSQGEAALKRECKDRPITPSEAPLSESVTNQTPSCADPRPNTPSSKPLSTLTTPSKPSNPELTEQSPLHTPACTRAPLVNKTARARRDAEQGLGERPSGQGECGVRGIGSHDETAGMKVFKHRPFTPPNEPLSESLTTQTTPSKLSHPHSADQSTATQPTAVVQHNIAGGGSWLSWHTSASVNSVVIVICTVRRDGPRPSSQPWTTANSPVCVS